MSFDRLAPHYNWLERLLAGNKLQLCRTAFLAEFATAESILLIGEGHGRFLPELIKTNPHARVVCVDQSSAMLERARDRLGTSNSNISFVVEDIFQFEPRTQFGAVAAHFFLDCFDAAQLKIIVPRIGGWLRSGGLWNIADFQVPDRFLRGMRARLVLALAYSFFRFTTNLPGRKIINPGALLKDLGFERIKREEFNFSLLYSELWKKS